MVLFLEAAVKVKSPEMVGFGAAFVALTCSFSTTGVVEARNGRAARRTTWCSIIAVPGIPIKRGGACET